MLKRLDIQNYRILRDLHVEALGSVNLIVGKNNAGKSTVLEAIRVFAGNARRNVLEKIASAHDERLRPNEVNGDLPFQDLFSRTGTQTGGPGVILIGDSRENDNYLTIENVVLREFRETVQEGEEPPRTVVRRRRVEKGEESRPDEILRKALAVTKNGRQYNVLIDSSNSRTSRLLDDVDTQKCSIVPTRFVSMSDLAEAWDGIVFSDGEQLVNDAIRYVAPSFEGLTFVNMEEDREEPSAPRRYYREPRRLPIVKLKGTQGSFPLRSLGDGVFRAFQLSIKLIQAKGGFLLIDEFENGLHYSVQEDVWRYVFRAAREANIQVFATTHSWDCVQSFARVSAEENNADGLLFRVGTSVRTSDQGSVIATSFRGDELTRISLSDLEVR